MTTTMAPTPGGATSSPTGPPTRPRSAPSCGWPAATCCCGRDCGRAAVTPASRAVDAPGDEEPGRAPTRGDGPAGRRSKGLSAVRVVDQQAGPRAQGTPDERG